MVSLSLDTPELAKIYDMRGQRQFDHGKLLIRDLQVSAGQSILDIGTGTGLLAAHAAEIVGTRGLVLGIDPLPLRIALARGRASQNLKFEVGSAEDLSSLRGTSFDIVYLNSVFHWIANKRVALQQIHRVLKPKGRVGVSTASLEQSHSVELARQRALSTSGLTDLRELGKGIPYRINAKEVRSLFRATGFKLLTLEIRTFVDYDDTVDSILEFSKSSSFGNDLAALSDEQRTRFLASFEAELETLRDERGIRQERHLIFATAEKLEPALS
jgi:ubiquinone/menaquinone biosynthesis C-methylase UbiE